MLAAKHGGSRTVAKLLRAGADPSAKDTVPVAMLSHARWCAAERHRCFHTHATFIVFLGMPLATGREHRHGVGSGIER